MTSAAQASAGRVGANKTDHPINPQRDALDFDPQGRRRDVVERGQRPQVRLPRAPSEAGLHRIVDAMRAALRSRQNIHVTRKEIAQFAGVTPALVTYYFPEKDDLIEAVTIPIVTAMVEAVQDGLSGAGHPRENLLQAIDVLIEAYAKDAVIIDLFIAHRGAKDDILPDLIGGMEAALVDFFGQWLQRQPDRVYDAIYLQKAAIGMCKIVARRDRSETVQDALPDSRRMTRAEAICAILLAPVAESGGHVPAAGTGPASSTGSQTSGDRHDRG